MQEGLKSMDKKMTERLIAPLPKLNGKVANFPLLIKIKLVTLFSDLWNILQGRPAGLNLLLLSLLLLMIFITFLWWWVLLSFNNIIIVVNVQYKYHKLSSILVQWLLHISISVEISNIYHFAVRDKKNERIVKEFSSQSQRGTFEQIRISNQSMDLSGSLKEPFLLILAAQLMLIIVIYYYIMLYYIILL